MSDREVFDIDFGSLWYRATIPDTPVRAYHLMQFGPRWQQGRFKGDRTGMRAVVFACGYGPPQWPHTAEVEYGQFLHRVHKCLSCRQSGARYAVDAKSKAKFWQEHSDRVREDERWFWDKLMGRQ